MVEILLLAAASMFWPLLLIVVVIAVNTPAPVKILGWFYLGGFLTAVSVGTAMVFALQDSSLMKGSSFHAAPGLDIVVGVLAIVGAVVLQRVHLRRQARPKPAVQKQSKSSERVERLVENGGPLAFVGGILATVLPGPTVILGMASIAQLGYSTSETFLVIVGFFLVMFGLVEVPLVGFVVAPTWTKATVAPFNAWLASNLIRIAVWALAIVGVAELIRGIVTLLRQ